METQNIPNSQSDLEKDKQNWRNHVLYTAEFQKSKQYGTSTKTKIQINRIENPEIKSFTYGQLISDKGGKYIQWGKESLFNEYAGKSGQQHVKE